MSSTYRQSSKVKKENRLIDSDNTYLANYPRQKLSAEMIRDNALATSKMLGKKSWWSLALNLCNPQDFGMK